MVSILCFRVYFYPEQLMVLLCLTSTADTAPISEMIAGRLAALQTKLVRDSSQNFF